ncbi:MAG: hypothetical protein K8953_09540, partial [Proteobacteria bacterium]|nr:hypothetical protein [Pseudomonadota bacterium]
YHAGIHPNTNVGAVLGVRSLQSRSTTATWKGWYYAHQNKTFKDSKNYSGPVDFLVNYGGNRRITISYDRANGNRLGGVFSIQGTDKNGGLQWDDRGVVTGLIHHKEANRPSGKVTGLIGEQGLVAVFVSDPHTGTKPHYGYVGGFIACPRENDNAALGCIK